jgi:hypothetical protein
VRHDGQCKKLFFEKDFDALLTIKFFENTMFAFTKLAALFPLWRQTTSPVAAVKLGIKHSACCLRGGDVNTRTRGSDVTSGITTLSSGISNGNDS